MQHDYSAIDFYNLYALDGKIYAIDCDDRSVVGTLTMEEV
jgi:hypothetical protein